MILFHDEEDIIDVIFPTILLLSYFIKNYVVSKSLLELLLLSLLSVITYQEFSNYGQNFQRMFAHFFS